MATSDLAIQFCLELSFGVLLALAFVPRAPVGRLFYRVMGSTAMAPLLFVALSPLLFERSGWADAHVVCAFAGLLFFPIVSGPFHGRRWAAGLLASLAASGAGLVFMVRSGVVVEGFAPGLLASLSALATGTVAGSVGLAMVLGHWYLTVPKLEVRHLERLNRVTVWSMLASLLLLGLTCLAFRASLNEAATPLLGPWGLFYLGSRVTVGLVMPLVFAWMTAGCLKFKNTRSATGILYASTILVLIGTAISISLQDTYGVPL